MPFKLTLKDFVVQDPFILDLSWTRIRDQIVIDAKLQQKILDESYPRRHGSSGGSRDHACAGICAQAARA
ncbi:MAG TPA: hypothetical protein VII95_11770 [Terriglobales bacterium]|jgi:hypothetical protein